MKKIRIEFIVLGVLALVLVLYIIFNNASRQIDYRLPSLSKVKQEDITRFALESQTNGTITINKDGDSWLIQPQGYKVDETVIKDLLTNTTDLSLTELISTTGVYGTYELDEPNRIKVTAYNGDKVVREFEVGKQSNTYSHSYVKLINDKNVYHANGNLKLIYGKKLDELRDKKILKFDKNTVKKITLTLNDPKKKLEPLTLIKSETPQQAETPKDKNATPAPSAAPIIEWKTPEGAAKDTQAVSTILDNATELVCKDFAPDNEDLSKPLFNITIEADKTYELKAFAAKSDGSYPAMSSLTKYVFYLQSWNGNTFKENIEKLMGITPTTPAPQK